VTGQIEQLVNRVVAAVDGLMPRAAPDSGAEYLALAAIRRLADLVASELALLMAGRWSTSRIIGRSSLEAWLWINYLLLEPELALDRIFAEDAGQQGKLEYGRGQVWERLESKRSDGIDLRMGIAKTPDARRANVEELAVLVADARAVRGLGGGKAIVDYQLIYRRDSVEDVHFGFSVAGRYCTNRAVPSAQPDVDSDGSAFRGPRAVRESALLLSDALGIYLTVKDRTEDLERLKAKLGAPLDP
jgi:hypothetical protein